AQTDFHSSQAALPLRQSHARFPQQDFRTYRPVCVGYASGQYRKSSFLELPLELCDFVFTQKAPLAGPEFFVLKKTNPDPTECFNRMADRLEHAPDLLISALVQCNFKPRVVAAFQLFDFAGRQALVVNVGTTSKLIQLTFPGGPSELHLIHLWNNARLRHEL